MADEKNAAATDPMYISMLLSLESSAMQALGKIMNPISQKIEKNLDQAQMTIDMISMLERKTAGNLTEEEEKYTKRALYQLRMNYLDEVNAAGEALKDDVKKTEETAETAESKTESEESTDKSTE